MGGGDPQAPVTNNYQDTMWDALTAQIKLAPELYAAESNDQYGRPAYARLMNDISMEGLLGKEYTVDSEGYTTEFIRDEIPEGGFRIDNNEEKWTRYLQDNPDLAKVIRSGRDPDGSRAYWTYGKKPWEAARDHYQGHGKKEGRKVWDIGMYDAEGNAVIGATKKTYVGGEAGTFREGGGIVDLIAGTNTFEFSDGTTRKAGFDVDGNFLGTAQLEQDILERVKDRNARTEIGLVEKYGGDLTDAYRSQGGIQEALDSYNKLAEQGTDHLGLRTELLQQAKDELALGGELSDRERRNVEQASRSAMTARGRGRDFSAIVDEVASNDMYTRQRQNERRMFAGQAIGLADQGRQMDQAFAAQRIGLEQATSADPFLALTGRASGASVGAGQNLYGNAAAGIGAGPTLFNPAQGAEFMANQSAMINNYNAAIYGADQARSGAIIGGALGAVGSLGGGIAQGMGAAAGCWVAREVYGLNNPKWMIFRHWMLFLSPFWFKAIYLNFGERFAKFIKNKPRLKARIRAWMDTKIREAV